MSVYPTVHSVVEFHAKGPWKTKSGGELSVAFALPIDTILSQYFRYAASELARVQIFCIAMKYWKKTAG